MSLRKASNYNILDSFSHFVPGGGQIVILCVWLLVGALLGNVVTLIYTAVAGGETAMDAALLISYPVMFLPAIIYALMRSRTNESFEKGFKLDSNHFKPLGGLVCAALAMLGTICLSFVSEFFISLLPDMPAWLEEVLGGLTKGKVWINFIAVSIFAPVFEEWLCRGMVLRGLLNCKRKNGRGIKPFWAITISAAFFAVIHANPWQAIAAFLLGALFGFVYYKTGSLKLTMFMHFVNNTFSLALSHIPSLKDMETWADVMDKTTYSIVFVLCILAAAFVVFEFSKVRTQSTSGNCDEVPALFDEQ